MNYIKLSPTLFLAEKVVNAAAKSKPVPEPTNHIWEIDRSGSMGGLLPSLIADLKTKARELRPGDTLSLGWFSGTGQQNFVLKGFRFGTDADLLVLDRAFDSLSRTVDLTCFSEILEATEQVCADVSIFSKRFAFMLFTDGYPVVSNYGREVERIRTAVGKLKAVLTSALIVGYGDYYNKELLADIGQRIGGALIHSSALPHFGLALQAFVRDQEAVSSRVGVSTRGFDADATFFTLQGQNVVVLQRRDDDSVDVPTTATGGDRLYVLQRTPPSGGKAVKFSRAAILKAAGTASPLVRGAYAAAAVLVQQMKTDKALDVLAVLGDVRLIDGANNAFTNAEYGAIEDSLRVAAADPKQRLLGGYAPEYVPAADAYCLLDLLDDLRGAKFYPSHPDFEYKRTGPQVRIKEGYGKFSPDFDAAVAMADFVWHGSRLNLSLRATIRGTVELQPRDGKTAANFGLLAHYPAFVHRNYTLVKDGALNVTRLPVKLPNKTVFNKLSALGAVHQGPYASVGFQPNRVYTIDLTRVPVMNRAMANGRTSAEDLAKAVWKETELEGKLKALKFYAKDLEKAEEAKKPSRGPGIDFLAANGIDVEKGGLYSPETEKDDSEDFYMAKSFEIAVRGCSSFPKVVDVETKMEALAKDPKAKPLTKSEDLVGAGIRAYKESGMPKQKQGVALAWLTDEISDTKAALAKVRTDIQKTKFAVILGKRWFDDLKTRDNPKLTVGDNEFTFKLGEEKVRF